MSETWQTFQVRHPALAKHLEGLVEHYSEASLVPADRHTWTHGTIVELIRTWDGDVSRFETISNGAPSVRGTLLRLHDPQERTVEQAWISHVVPVAFLSHPHETPHLSAWGRFVYDQQGIALTRLIGRASCVRVGSSGVPLHAVAFGRRVARWCDREDR